MTSLMNLVQKMCEEKTFQLKYISTAMICVARWFEVKTSGVSCPTLILEATVGQLGKGDSKDFVMQDARAMLVNIVQWNSVRHKTRADKM